MKTGILLWLLLWIMTGTAYSETLQEKADRIHKTRQQDSESVVLGALSGSEMSFATAGAVAEGGRRPDEHTLYEIGSITKVFTAILLAEAVREGKAKLDAPVANYLPKSAVGKDSPLESAITLESLATHTSGLPRIPKDLFSGADGGNPYAHYNEKRLFAYLKSFRAQDLESPGKFSYSNLGFGLLGTVLERIFETTYPELVKEKIFIPLGMNDSVVPERFDSLPEEIRNRLATGHHGGKPVPHWELASLKGAGAIVSSAHDLLLFARAHWAEDTPPGLLASLREAAKPRQENMGLGWMLTDDSISHGGGTGGFRTHLAINLQAKTAEVDLRNSAGDTMEVKREGDFTGISGFWEGTLNAGAVKLRLVRYIGIDGRILSFSIDQGCGFTEATATSYVDGTLTASFPTIGGFYEGRLEDGMMKGTWTQSGELPLDMTRSDTMPESLKAGLAKKFPDDLTPLLGHWSGYLGGNQGLFVYIRFERFADQQFLSQMFSPDQVEAPISISKVSFQEKKLAIDVIMVGGKFRGEFDPENRTISGTWTQGRDIPLTLTWSNEVPARE